MGKLINEKNEWDYRISSGIKGGPADCIKISEVATALQKMKKHKGQGLSGLAAELIQATGDIRTQWLFNLYNGIAKEGYSPKMGTRPNFCDNVGKGTTIFIILSPVDSLVNL